MPDKRSIWVPAETPGQKRLKSSLFVEPTPPLTGFEIDVEGTQALNQEPEEPGLFGSIVGGIGDVVSTLKDFGPDLPTRVVGEAVTEATQAPIQRGLGLAERPFQVAGALTGALLGEPRGTVFEAMDIGTLEPTTEQNREVLELGRRLLSGGISPKDFAGQLIAIQESKPIPQQLLSELPASLIPPIGAVQKGRAALTEVERLAAAAVRGGKEVAETAAPVARRLLAEELGAVGPGARRGAVGQPSQAAPTVTIGEGEKLGRRLRIFEDVDPEASIKMLESGESPVLAPRVFKVHDDISSEPLLHITTRQIPAGRNQFSVDIKGLDLSGNPLDDFDVTLQHQFSFRELLELARNIMDKTGADSLSGYRLPQTTSRLIQFDQSGTLPLQSITRAQVEKALAKESPTVTIGEGLGTQPLHFSGEPPVPPRDAPPLPPPPPEPPVGGFRIMEDLQSFDEAIQIGSNPDTFRRVANLPGIRGVMSKVNPSAVADTPEKLALMGRAQLRFEGQQKSIQVAAHFERLGNQDRIFGALTKEGRLSTGSLKGLVVNDIRANPSKYADKLTEEQRIWIQALDDVERTKLDALKRNGIDIKELAFEDGGQYAGRRVFSKVGPDGDVIESAYIGGGQRPGAKLSVEKTRLFATEEEAIEAGFRYLKEDEALTLNVMGAYNRIADKQFTDWIVKNIPTEKLTAARAKKFGEAGVQIPALGGRVFTGPRALEIATTLQRGMNPEFSEVLDAVNKVNAVGRMFQLAGDASPFMIQMLYMAMYKPTIYAKAIPAFIRAMFDTRFHANLLAKHAKTIQNHPGIILTKHGTEFTEALSKGGFLTKGPIATLAKPLRPFQRGFEVSMDTAGIYMAEALEHLGTTPARMRQVDDFVNEIRGLASSAKLGVSPIVRQLETAATLAPRYNRAMAALVVDTFRFGGNLRGTLAREALGKSVMGLSALAVAISMSMGETLEEATEHLLPNSPKFFTWEIAGQNIGPGTKIRSLIKLLAASIDEPESLMERSMENPVLSFMRGNAAPVTSNAVDILTGRNYIGEPTTDSLGNFVKEIAAPLFMPIWIQSLMLEGGTAPERATRGVTEFFGGRAYPMGEYQAFAQYAEEKLGKPYEDATRAERKSLQLEDARGRELWTKYQEETARLGRVQPSFQEMARARDTRGEELEAATEAFRAGRIDRRTLRDNIQEAGKRLGAKYDAIETNPVYARELDEWKGKPKELPEDEAYRQYQNISNDPQWDLGPEGFDFDGRDKALAAFRKEVGESLWSGVEENLRLDRASFPEEVQEYYRDIEQLSAYWDIQDDNERIKSNKKLVFRSQNPAIDVLLLKWGYVSSPRTQAGWDFVNQQSIQEEEPTAEPSRSLWVD